VTLSTLRALVQSVPTTKEQHRLVPALLAALDELEGWQRWLSGKQSKPPASWPLEKKLAALSETEKTT
jgi:hypothetical protein